MEWSLKLSWKVSVDLHGYRGGNIKTLIAAVNSGLFLHYLPHVVICQIGGNDCSADRFDIFKFEANVEYFIAMCHKWGVAVIFMSVLKRGNPWFCEQKEYIERRDEVNKLYKNMASKYYFVYHFHPVNIYHSAHEHSDGVHFTEEGYLALLVAFRKALSWFINEIKKPIDG